MKFYITEIYPDFLLLCLSSGTLQSIPLAYKKGFCPQGQRPPVCLRKTSRSLGLARETPAAARKVPPPRMPPKPRRDHQQTDRTINGNNSLPNSVPRRPDLSSLSLACPSSCPSAFPLPDPLLCPPSSALHLFLPSSFPSPSLFPPSTLGPFPPPRGPFGRLPGSPALQQVTC